MTFDPRRTYGDSGPVTLAGEPTYSYSFFPAPLPRFNVPNKRLAVQPFPSTERKNEAKGGVIKPLNQAELTPLRVVFGSDFAPAGAIVYVRSDLPLTTAYAKPGVAYEVDGQKFILIPETDVALIDRGA